MATTTTTAVPLAEATNPTPKPEYGRRPQDSMKSSWRTASRSSWNLWHWLIHITNIYPVRLDKEIPVFKKDDPLPYFSHRYGHRWILTHAAWPMLIQFLAQQYTGKPWSAIGTFFFYTFAMQFNSIHQIWVIRRMSHQYGFLDGDKHARDQVPDIGVMKTVLSLVNTTTFRPMIAVIASYQRSTELQLNPKWLPLELALYGVVLDLFFYTYHRSCHELDGLWKYHRTHHLTKHPNVLLSSYADEEQEFLEIALIPFLTWATMKFILRLPMGFHDWWICHQYVIFVEAFGHSGIRMWSTTITFASPILSFFGMDLQLEDHDLHHRKGWRKSHNYGKQTRVWDKIFGTMGPRIEAVEGNVDFNNVIVMPWY